MSRVAAPPALDVARVRAQFPILGRTVHGRPLVYLDSAATTQKPRAVLDALRAFYEERNSNIHRGVHWLSQAATEAFEAARAKVQRFLNAEKSREILFTRGTTEGINLVAQAWGRKSLAAGDEVLLTGMEHHSNIVPWQMICEERGARLVVAPITDEGELDWEAFAARLGPRTRLVAAVHVSNSLGTVNPVRRIVEAAHAAGALVLLDGAQAVSHLEVDLRALDCDFYAFSGHKLYGPTGIGVLYGKEELLEAMPPWQGGGDMIRSVTFEKTLYNVLPWKFEAGTPDIAGAIGLGAAIDFLLSLGRGAVTAHEAALLDYATKALGEVEGLRRIGTAREKAAVASFVLEGIHPHDIGTIVDSEGVAIRTGHHCTQPVMDRFGVPATARASFGVYNTPADLDALVDALRKAIGILRG
ncbi:MAG: SufS family cysteine desulfurase [Planctomycetaceae bacterium]